MNCCNDYGKCKGGKGCPVGDMPVKMMSPEPDLDPRDGEAISMEVMEWVVIAAVACMLVTVGFYLGRATA